MDLPFTRADFFAVFAAYNETLWPAAVTLWAASVGMCAWLVASRRPLTRSMSALLAAHWAWSALAYHAAFFTRINPAAWLFAGLFLLEAALLLWWGAVRGRISYSPRRSRWIGVAVLLVAYSLVYPALSAAQHGTWLAIPTFGVPCPTTIFTAGVLMLATPLPKALVIVPIAWAMVGGSAAALLDVRADYALPVAGAALAMFAFHGAFERRRTA